MMDTKGYLVIGNAGCGKTSFCLSMKKFLSIDQEIPVLINLDSGTNDCLLKFDINIKEMVISDEIIPELHIGPNTSIVYSLEYFEKNKNWFEYKLKKFIKSSFPCYIFFDFPGQAELFTFRFLFQKFVKRLLSMNIKLIVINIIDSFFLKDKSLTSFLLLLYITVTFNIELLQIHLISKSDLFKKKNSIRNLKNCLNYNYTYSIINYHPFTFFWSKKISYDFIHIIIQDFFLNIIPFSVYSLYQSKLVYKKIRHV
nr:ATP-binding protein [Cryptomonas paramecium]